MPQMTGLHFQKWAYLRVVKKMLKAISASGENSIMDRNLIVIFHPPHEGGDAISRK
jgi:hypothetical protein